MGACNFRFCDIVISSFWSRFPLSISLIQEFNHGFVYFLIMPKYKLNNDGTNKIIPIFKEAFY